MTNPVVHVHPPKIDLSRWPRDDHYSRLRHNTFDNFEQVHRYVVEIGGLAVTLMDDVAKKFGVTFKPAPRDSDLVPGDPDPFAFQRSKEFIEPIINVYSGPGDDPRNG